MKRVCLILVCASMVIFTGMSRADLVRTLPSTVAPGEEFTVEFTVNLPAAGAYFIIEEYFPDPFSLSDSGLFHYNPPNRLAYVNLPIVTGPITMTYDLYASTTPGDYFWPSTGQFGFGPGGYPIEGIVGDNKVTVTPVPAAVLLGVLGLGVASLKLRKFA